MRGYRTYLSRETTLRITAASHSRFCIPNPPMLTCAPLYSLFSPFAATPPKSRIHSLLALRVRSMAKRNIAKTSLLNAGSEKYKKSKEAGPNADGLGGVMRIVSACVKDDPGKIEAMTVEQLRKISRDVGIPAKGRKSELVSALKRFLDDKQFNGETAQEAVDAQSNSSSDEACAQSVNGGGSEVSGLRQYKRRAKRLTAKNDNAEVNVNIVKENELLIGIDGGSVLHSSLSRRKISSDVVSENKADILIAMPQAEPWTILAHKKPQKGWIPYNPRTMRPPPLPLGTDFVKLMSWNVNGLRALLKLEGFSALELAQRENFDVLCLQETKLQEKDVESIKQSLIDGYKNSFWTCSRTKLGYSGTAVISRIKPLSVNYGLGIPEHDSEGRVVTVEFDSFYLLSVYVPNSGDGLKRLSYRITEWDLSLSNYMKELEKSKPVILTGDLNCAHQEIDIYNPAGNKRSAGFTDEERQSFGANFLSKGYVDTFRVQHPNVVGYTYWGFRHGGRKTNRGWRLDYFLVSESLADKVHDSYIVPDVIGSDHCPIGLVLKL